MLLKTRTLKIAAFLIALQAGLCLAAGNLLCDNGFELSEPNWGFPDSGCWFKNATFDDVAGCTTESARSGSNGLLLHTGFAVDQWQSQIYQDTPATAGKQYFASAWVNTSADVSWVDGSKVKIKLAFLNISKNTLVEYTSDEVNTPGSGWSLLYFATNLAPHYTRYARLTLSLEKPESGAGGLAIASFDDCILREIECADCITLDEIPPCGSSDKLTGSVTGVNPADYSVGVYILNAGWWPKPTFVSPWTEIQSDGSWQCDITTSPSDLNAAEVMAFLVPKAEIPDWPVDFTNQTGLPAMPGEAFRFPSVGAFRPSCGCTSLQFAGYNWLVKDSLDARVDPGQNWFDCNNAWVDANGLHLKITNTAGKWRCAEVFTEDSLGDGTYRFELQNNTASLDPNVVLGLFTWDEFAPQYKNRELDIEIGRWGDPANSNAQYVIQPSNKSGHLHRFNIDPCDADTITHTFDWGLGIVAFDSFFDSASPIQSWAYSGTDVPWPGGENIRINLWLNGGQPYYDSETEVVIKNFEFTPCTYQVEQASIDFNSVLISKTVTRPVTITNEGQCSPYVVTVDVNGPDAANFLVADWAFSLEPGESKQIDVAFVPDTNRVFNANLRITGDKRVVNVPLTGIGVRFNYTRVPTVGSPDFLQGTVSGVRPSDYRVVSYVFTDKWYIKPTYARSALRPISSAGAWKCDIDVEPTDKLATQVASFLVPKNAGLPPSSLNSLNDPQMGQYQHISADKLLLAISNVVAKAGPAASDDSITINGRYYITLAEMISTTQLCISILQADQVIWNDCVPFNFNDAIRPQGLTYNKNGVYITMRNFWNRLPTPYEYAGNIRLSLHKADLTCLRSPLALKVEIGDFVASAVADESLDPAIINGSQPVPFQFLSGCTDSMRVDKLTIKNSSRANNDSVYLKGVIVFKDAAPDLTIEDVSVGWGDSAFTVPAGTFKRTSKNRPKYSCKKFNAAGGVVDGLFDFKAGTFWVKVSKATLDTESANVAFNLAMGAFSEGVSIDTGH
ncbi:MAG: hypothetical protein ABSG97_01580 [Sedimentisphaerales bacterium]